MGRAKSPNRDKAFEIYKEHNGSITSQELADLLGEKINNINTWKSKDRWNDRLNKVGAPYGNKNAVGNNGGGAPKKNQNARTYGWYSKYYPTVARNLIQEAEEAGGNELEILWAMIMTKWIAIIRAQKIMHVKNQNDLTKELKRQKQIGGKNPGWEKEYELQFAWDKQAQFLNSQSRAMTTLTNMLVKYNEMVHANWDTATEEQKLRVDRLKVQIENEKKGIGSNSLVIFKGEDFLED